MVLDLHAYWKKYLTKVQFLRTLIFDGDMKWNILFWYCVKGAGKYIYRVVLVIGPSLPLHNHFPHWEAVGVSTQFIDLRYLVSVLQLQLQCWLAAGCTRLPPLQCCTILGWLQAARLLQFKHRRRSNPTHRPVQQRVHHPTPSQLRSEDTQSANYIVWMSVKLCNNSSRNLYCPDSGFLEIFLTFIPEEPVIRRELSWWWWVGPVTGGTMLSWIKAVFLINSWY